MAHDVDGTAAPLHARYRCKGPRCPMVMDSARRSAENLQKGGGANACDIEWDDAAVKLHCKHGVSFNTMDDRCECM